MGAPDVAEPRAGGIWTLAGDRLIIAEAQGPATILVPTEQVRLLAVDLPLASRARRLEALPFAVEDAIAEPPEVVHLALGAEIAPRRYLVGVVRHEVMARWVEAAEEAGMGDAAMVPDALVLPQPPDGQWSADLGQGRAVVRASDGTGFACPAGLFQSAWQAAGRPAVTGYGAPLPDEMAQGAAPREATEQAERLLAPALDLRQGPYARRRAGMPRLWRRLALIAAIGASAHVVIAAADTLMLRAIADRRAADTRALVAQVAPGTALGEDIAGEVTDLLPPTAQGVPDGFLPLLTRVSGALGPLAGSMRVRGMGYQADALTIDLEATDAGLPARIEAALRAARVSAQVTRAEDGTVRIAARAA